MLPLLLRLPLLPLLPWLLLPPWLLLLPLLVSTLEKLQTAVGTLNANVKESAAGSSTIREAMQAVADATTELNVMTHDMVSTLNDKY